MQILKTTRRITKPKKHKLLVYDIFFISSVFMCLLLKLGKPFGYYELARMDPELIRNSAIPSTFLSNFSLSIIGLNIALKIIVKHDVDDISTIFP